MGANAPSQIIVPQAYTAKTLKLENESIEIKGKKELTYLWVPSAKAVVGVFRYLQVFIYGWQILLKPKIVWKSFNL